MSVCMICRFETPPDDVALRGPAGRFVCLPCYERETGSRPRMSEALKREIEAVLDAVSPPPKRA